MDRLNLAGAEKGTLSATLADRERALEELREREKQAQARLKTFQEMVDKFKAMIDSGKLRVRVVRGRMVVELAENILFDSGKDELKKEGQEALTQVASVSRRSPTAISRSRATPTTSRSRAPSSPPTGSFPPRAPWKSRASWRTRASIRRVVGSRIRRHPAGSLELGRRRTPPESSHRDRADAQPR